MTRTVTGGIAEMLAGRARSRKELVTIAFELVDLNGRHYVRRDPRYFRRTEIDRLRGDGTETRAKLGWMPRTTFRTLARILLEGRLAHAGLEPSRLLAPGISVGEAL